MNPPELGVFLWTVATFAIWGGTLLALITASNSPDDKRSFLLNWVVVLVMVSLSLVLLLHGLAAFDEWSRNQDGYY